MDAGSIPAASTKRNEPFDCFLNNEAVFSFLSKNKGKSMKALRVSVLNIYPIKSCAQVSLEVSPLDRFGLKYDRRWMIVDEQNVALTQRNIPLMATIKATVASMENGFNLTLLFGDQAHHIGLRDFSHHSLVERVSVWNDTCDGLPAPQKINHQLSEFLGTHCKLVYMPEDSQRFVNKKYATAGETVSYADGYPLLLTTEESLNQFNQWLGESITMNRFRPNLVISGSPPFAEDKWKSIRVGEIEIAVAKPCARCMIPSLDPESLEENPKVLTTLAIHRKQGKGVNFGLNIIPQSQGVIKVGDVVEILS